MSATATMGETITRPEIDEQLDVAVDTDAPWIVLVWNDPVNLMTYVTYVLQKLFGYSRNKAELLMLQVHQEGKAVVSSGARAQAEGDVAKLHAHGLWATLQQDR